MTKKARRSRHERKIDETVAITAIEHGVFKHAEAIRVTPSLERQQWLEAGC